MERTGIQGTFLKHNKGNIHIQQTNSQHQSKWREIQSDTTEIKNKIRLSISLYLFSIVLEVLDKAIRQQKKIQEDTNWKKKKSNSHYLLMI